MSWRGSAPIRSICFQYCFCVIWKNTRSSRMKSNEGAGNLTSILKHTPFHVHDPTPFKNRGREWWRKKKITRKEFTTAVETMGHLFKYLCSKMYIVKPSEIKQINKKSRHSINALRLNLAKTYWDDSTRTVRVNWSWIILFKGMFKNCQRYLTIFIHTNDRWYSVQYLDSVTCFVLLWFCSPAHWIWN